MPTYRVTLLKDWCITDEARVTVEADSADEAIDAAWEKAATGDVLWVSSGNNGNLLDWREEIELLDD